MTLPDSPGESFRAGTTRAAGWALTAVVAGRAISVAGLVILARLLVPEDFGLLAFALVYVTYAETLTDLGTGAALIYWPGQGRERDDIAQVTFLVNVVLGMAWFAITMAVAPWLADFFDRAETVGILTALAWAFPLKALGATHDALMQKDLRFRARVIPEVGLSLAKAIVAIVLALGGMGVWSLVWGHLAGVAASTLLLWVVMPWRPGWYLPLERIGPVLGYGRGIVAVNVIAAVAHHADLVIVGRVLGATALGVYQMAGRVPDLSLLMIARVGNRVLFPALARLPRDGGALGEACLASLRYLALLVVPVAAMMVLLAEPMVAVLFGDAWAAASPVLRLLAVYAGLRALGSFAGDAMKALGRPGLLAALGLVKVAVVVPALIVAAPFGVVAVAGALATVTFLTLALNLAALWRIGRITAGEMVDALRPAVIAATPAVVAVVAWQHAASAAPPWMRLIGGLGIGGAAYIATLLLVDRSSAVAVAEIAVGGRR